jgi:hypothetical protein
VVPAVLHVGDGPCHARPGMTPDFSG